MGHRTTYAPGTFCWTDLATADAAAATAFYGGLFGWEAEDLGTYTLLRLGGDVVGGLFETAEAPPHWMSHVCVEDADATAARAAELGATVLDAPFDVGPPGRMAVLRDPDGAVLALWQPAARTGADRVNDPGCLCMNELLTPDPDEAAAFYEQLFGWTSARVDLGPGAPGGFFHNEGRVNASLFDAAGRPPHWRSCFAVASVPEAVQRVVDLGGTVLVDPIEIGDGALAVVEDDQGASFSLFAGETDD